MNELVKSALVVKAPELGEKELSLINQQALRPLAVDEVFAFRLAACNNQIDRDWERFTEKTLKQLSKLFVGRPVLQDHRWFAGLQTARVYAAEVAVEGDVHRLVLSCYMPRLPQTEATIAAIECGILRECSVGVAIKRVVCSICGADNRKALCRHCHGVEYDGKVCHFDLDDARDAYEVSLVAVPAQPEAGVIKSKRYGGEELPEEPGAECPSEEELRLAAARMEQEDKRYGGI